MKKYRVINYFNDKESKTVRVPGEIIENISEKRVAEIIAAGPFIEEIKSDETDNGETAQEESADGISGDVDQAVNDEVKPEVADDKMKATVKSQVKKTCSKGKETVTK